MKKTILAGLAGTLLLGPAWAAEEADLGLGDPAPALHVAEWVKGAPVQAFVPGHVYLVEFWATW
ncbi:MAG: hypothetical protein ACYTG2_13920 [Planctomycetota bacterium]|jgi:hypothetical protein